MRKILLLFLSLGVLLGPLACSKDNTGVQDNAQGTGTGGSLARFTISGNYLYTVDHLILKAYSLENPESPLLTASVPVGWDIETIYPYAGNLFVGSQTAMYIYSLEDPAKPVQKGYANHVRACDPVVAQGDYAYVTVRTGAICGGSLNALLVYDVSDMGNPKELAAIPLKGPYGLGINDQTLYVCDGDAGLKVYDISTPDAPKGISEVDKGKYTFKDVIVYDDMLVCMTDQGMAIYDVSTANEPKFLTKIQ